MFAGSFTASCGQVFAGMGYFGSLVSTGGIGAGARMIADNVSNAFNSQAHVFWSGGETAMNAAKNFANRIGGKTLEMTRLGSYLEKINAGSDLWRAASANFANQSSGVVYSIQNSIGVRLQSVWATVEYGILKANPKIENFIYRVIWG